MSNRSLRRDKERATLEFLAELEMDLDSAGVGMADAGFRREANLPDDREYGIPRHRFVGIPDDCEDEELLTDLERWSDEVELWAAYPCIPVPGPNIEWVQMLDLLAKHGEAVKFPRPLADRLRAWIPQNMWESVVQGY